MDAQNANDSESLSVVATGPQTPDFQLHRLGWRNFQDLCGVVLRQRLGQSFVIFADSNDAGRDGAYYGTWKESVGGVIGIPDGSTVLQCKFSAKIDKTLTPSSLSEEFSKVEQLVSQELCDNYILATNCRLTGESERKIRQSLLYRGGRHAIVLDDSWFNGVIASSANLRGYVPRVYGLGNLSQILDKRAYRQADAVLSYLAEDLSTFVVTDAYNRAIDAVTNYGFLLLLGEPAVGESIIAATLSMAAVDNWKCKPLKLETAADFITHWNPQDR